MKCSHFLASTTNWLKYEVNLSKFFFLKAINTNLTYDIIRKDIEEAFAECEELDNLSNSVLDVTQNGSFDDAEKTCNELLKLYPDQVDGLERLSMIYEASGEIEKAVAYYKKTAEFARSKKGFDPEFVNWALDKAKKLGG